MASTLYKAQNALNVCNTHTSRKLTLFCRTCIKTTCIECVKLHHFDHSWDDISVVMNERRACLPTICRDIRQKKIPTLETLRSFKDYSDNILQQLEKKRISIIEATNKIIDEKKQRYKMLTQRGLSHSEIAEMLKYMDTITISLEESIHTYSDFDVLEMEQEMMSTLAKLESIKLEEEKASGLFIPGELDYKVLSDMVGEVISSEQEIQSTVDVTEMHTIKGVSSYTIRHAQSGQAWIRDSVDKTVKLYYNNGVKLKTMRYTCNDFVVMNNGDHVYTDREHKELRVTSPDGRERKLCSTNPLIPTRIGTTCEGDLLVNMRNDFAQYTCTSNSRRLVQRMNMSANVLTSYEFYDDGKTRLFTLAGSTIGNRNGDVCAINRTSKDSGELIILHKDGRVRAAYKGQDDSTPPFDPSDVACDSTCRVIVSDYNNRAVHLLSYDGTFLKYLLSGLSGKPECVALSADILWMSVLSSDSKTVKLYRYK